MSDGQLGASDDVTIVVGPQNLPPQVEAGGDQSLPQPGFVNLVGTATDDGLPASGSLTHTWSAVEGPAAVVFGNAAALAAKLKNERRASVTTIPPLCGFVQQL